MKHHIFSTDCGMIAARHNCVFAILNWYTSSNGQFFVHFFCKGWTWTRSLTAGSETRPSKSWLMELLQNENARKNIADICELNTSEVELIDQLVEQLEKLEEVEV